MKKIVEASEEELALCPGLGPQKVSQVNLQFYVIDEVFLVVFVFYRIC